MNPAKRIRTALVAPLALGLVLAAVTLRAAQTQPPPQTTPPSTQQPTTQQPPATQPAQPEKAEEATFTSPAGMLLIQIKPDQTAQFELLMTKLKDALSKTPNAQHKKMAQGWRVYKAAEPMGANALYIFFIEPTTPGDYQGMYKVIAEVFPTEVQDIHTKSKDAFAAGLGRLNLTQLHNFGGAAAGGSAPAPGQP